jgi:hypothetical protein
MDLYRLVPTFDRGSGKRSAPKLKLCGWVCDFCGHVWHSDEDEDDQSVNSYVVNEIGGAEPQFDGMSVDGYPDVNIYELMNTHPTFRYCVDWDSGRYCEADMIACAARGEYGKQPLLSTMQYHARCNMLKKLLDGREVHLAQLKLADPSELENVGAPAAGDSVTAEGDPTGQRYIVLTVDDVYSVGEFVEEKKLAFKGGFGFYQLTEAEKVSASKQVLLRERATGKLIGGDAARRHVGLPANETAILKPVSDPTYDVFVQTKTRNRWLKPQTLFIYRVDR